MTKVVGGSLIKNKLLILYKLIDLISTTFVVSLHIDQTHLVLKRSCRGHEMQQSWKSCVFLFSRLEDAGNLSLQVLFALLGSGCAFVKQLSAQDHKPLTEDSDIKIN